MKPVTHSAAADGAAAPAEASAIAGAGGRAAPAEAPAIASASGQAAPGRTCIGTPAGQSAPDGSADSSRAAAPVALDPLYPLLYEPLVRAALAEDLGRAGDLTTDATVAPGAVAVARLVARRAGRL
ncbi:MAG TPA: hypothetical protein VF100_13060, partial [Thermoanaerobaculia bacterium]